MDFRSLIPFRSGLADRPVDPFTAMRREMERLFDDFGRWPGVPAPEGLLTPRVDLAETAEGLELTAELPGVAEKDIDLEIEDGVLTLRAEHKTERRTDDKDRRWHLVERSQGTYLRRFQLPFRADEDKVSARFDNGVLKVHVPRSPEAAPKARKIALQSA
jgi:HSP20 family protein